MLYSNRSAILCKLNRFQEALEDAERSYELNPEWVKVRFKKYLLNVFFRFCEHELIVFVTQVLFVHPYFSYFAWNSWLILRFWIFPGPFSEFLWAKEWVVQCLFTNRLNYGSLHPGLVDNCSTNVAQVLKPSFLNQNLVWKSHYKKDFNIFSQKENTCCKFLKFRVPFCAPSLPLFPPLPPQAESPAATLFWLLSLLYRILFKILFIQFRFCNLLL